MSKSVKGCSVFSVTVTVFSAIATALADDLSCSVICVCLMHVGSDV